MYQENNTKNPKTRHKKNAKTRPSTQQHRRTSRERAGWRLGGISVTLHALPASAQASRQACAARAERAQSRGGGGAAASAARQVRRSVFSCATSRRASAAGAQWRAAPRAGAGLLGGRPHGCACPATGHATGDRALPPRAVHPRYRLHSRGLPAAQRLCLTSPPNQRPPTTTVRRPRCPRLPPAATPPMYTSCATIRTQTPRRRRPLPLPLQAVGSAREAAGAARWRCAWLRTRRLRWRFCRRRLRCRCRCGSAQQAPPRRRRPPTTDRDRAMDPAAQTRWRHDPRRPPSTRPWPAPRDCAAPTRETPPLPSAPEAHGVTPAARVGAIRDRGTALGQCSHSDFLPPPSACPVETRSRRPFRR